MKMFTFQRKLFFLKIMMTIKARMYCFPKIRKTEDLLAGPLTYHMRIDFPGFNVFFGKSAKLCSTNNLKVLCYIIYGFSQNQEDFFMLKRINLLLYSLCFKNIIGVHFILL